MFVCKSCWDLMSTTTFISIYLELIALSISLCQVESAADSAQSLSRSNMAHKQNLIAIAILDSQTVVSYVMIDTVYISFVY